MNPTAIAPSAAGRVRVLIAALVSFLLIIAGAVAAPSATAAEASMRGSVTSATSDGVTVQVEASGLGAATGAYAALIVKGTESSVTAGGGYAAFALPFPVITDGATAFTLNAPAASLDRTLTYEVLIWQQHTAPSASTIYARGDVSIAPEQWDAVFGPLTGPEEPAPEEPTPGKPAPGEAEPEEPAPGGGEPGETEPGETEPGETEPGETEPGETAPGEGAPEEETPQEASLDVFLADGETPAAGTTLKSGDEIVVVGSGYDPTANVGGRGVPIPSHLPQGTYVVFGDFASNWQPSAGAPSSARSVGAQAWALAEEVLDQVPAQFQNAIRAQWVDISAEGTFRATLTLKDAPGAPQGGAYGVYTYGAGGVINAAQERSVLLDYAKTPKITVSDAAASATVEAGISVRVDGSDFGTATGVYAALIEEGTESEITTGGGFLAMQYVRGVSGGSFTTELTTTIDRLDRTKSYEVIVWQQHTMPSSATIYARSAVTIPDALWPEPDGPSVEAAVSDVSQEDGLTVTTSAANLGAISGAYVALIEEGTEADVTAGGGFLAMQYVRGITAGAFEIDLVAASADLDRTKTYEVIVWQQHTMPTTGTIYARDAVAITPEQWDVLKPEKPETPKPPTPPTTPGTSPGGGAGTVAGGSLRWAISSSFTNYVTGPIAQGAIAVSGGATRSGGQFQFGQAPGSTYDAQTGLGTVTYRGAVRFTGHHGALDVTVSQPQVRITSAGAATLYVTSGGAQVPFATLDLAAAAKTTASGAVTYTAAPATLTAVGRDRVLAGFSTSLNPVTFTVGIPAAAPNGVTGTVATASVSKKAELPSTPPATAGIQIDDANLASLQSGGPATITASGFQPNEEDIAVVVYSTPVLLDTVTADAEGVATWTGTLPATLADGEHTLTLQGSIAHGLVFTLDRGASVVAGQCTVDAATLAWGYKESFRTYIEGIANGGWELTGLVYEYPEYVWSGGTGSFDPVTGSGLVTYGGSIAFSGHDGALDTTIANARVELAGDTGYLVFDVSGTTQSGDQVDQEGVRFAEFDLTGVAAVDGVLTLDAVPATLTGSGAAAFGTYAAGEALDPVSAVIPVGADCGAAAPEPQANADAVVAEVAVQNAADDGEAPVWPWILGSLLVIAVAVTAGVLISRRGKGEDAAAEPAESVDA